MTQDTDRTTEVRGREGREVKIPGKSCHVSTGHCIIHENSIVVSAIVFCDNCTLFEYSMALMEAQRSQENVSTYRTRS